MRRKLGSLFAMCSVIALSACSDTKSGIGNQNTDSVNLNHLDFTVEMAPEWTSLFKRNSGWFGGDGIFAVTRDGKEAHGSSANSETFIWFSDTMIGEIDDDSLQPGWTMINNSMAVLKDGKPDAASIRFTWDSTAEKKPVAIFTPQTP